MLFSRCGLTTDSLKVIVTSLNLPALLLLLKDAVRIFSIRTQRCPTFSLLSSRVPKSFATWPPVSQPVSPQPIITECPHLWAGCWAAQPFWVTRLEQAPRTKWWDQDEMPKMSRLIWHKPTDAVTGRRCKDILRWHPKLCIWNPFSFGENLEHLSGIYEPLHTFLSILWCRQVGIRIHI